MSTRDYVGLFRSIADQWFVAEPLLFTVLCTHELTANDEMLCLMRSGQMRIEYNPALLNHLDDSDIRQMLRTEIIRIMLLHPYMRQPLNPDRVALVIASDITISEHGYRAYGMYTRENWVISDGEAQLPHKGHFEEYYFLIRERIMQQIPVQRPSDQDREGSEFDLFPWAGGPGGIGAPRPLSGASDVAMREDAGVLWEPDEVARQVVTSAVERELAAQRPGSVTNGLIAEIRASQEVRPNLRRQLAMFRKSVLSRRRELSRMRPSRRYGFSQMGVRHPYDTRLLVGIDTSSSVSDADLAEFLSVVNHFFRCGAERIDVVSFDCQLHLPVVSMRKAVASATFVGRGGTDFQPIVDYFEANGYDGLIVFTDGEAPAPVVGSSARVLWAITDRYSYDATELTPKICLH